MAVIRRVRSSIAISPAIIPAGSHVPVFLGAQDTRQYEPTRR